jgi:two-component system OmpR family response regulator
MSEFKVLLIDDEEELVATLAERLGYRGIEAEYALEGHEALAKMKDNDFDVVVLDLKLPGMSGLDVLARLKKDYAEVPVLLITGHGSTSGNSEPVPEGAADYLIKPINLEDLISRMRQVIKSL